MRGQKSEDATRADLIPTRKDRAKVTVAVTVCRNATRNWSLALQAGIVGDDQNALVWDQHSLEFLFARRDGRRATRWDDIAIIYDFRK